MFKSVVNSNFTTIIVFLVGLVSGLILTSLYGNSALTPSSGYSSFLRTPAGRELVNLLHRYNETLATHLGGPDSHDEVKRRDDAIGNRAPVTFGDSKFHNGKMCTFFV